MKDREKEREGERERQQQKKKKKKKSHTLFLFLFSVPSNFLSLSIHNPFFFQGALVSTPDMYVKKWGDAGNSKSGDVHFYTTVDNALNTSTFPRAKFVSEFGFQSFPSWQAVKKYSEPQDWSYLSPLSTFLQRHPGDTEDMMKQMDIHYQVPPAYAPAGSPPSEQSTLFQKWIYLTQVYQAATYDAASTYWRRIKTEPDAQTMGVLYW